MELLVFVLNKPEFLDEILEGFLKVGLHGATIIDSTGMGRTLCDKVPIFGGLRSIVQGCRPNTLTIFTVVPDITLRTKAVNVIEEIIGDLKEPNTGFLFCVPVSMSSAFAEPLNNK